MGGKLLYRDAQGRDAAADLVEAGSYLGRAVECAVRTDDAMVSRRNCKISVTAGRWYVEDLGSANGTYVTTGNAQERRIQKDPLTHGDIIRCGSLQVRFVEVADPAPRPNSPVQQPQVDADKSGPKADQSAKEVDPTSLASADKQTGSSKGASPDGPSNSGLRKPPPPPDDAKSQEDLKKSTAELELASSALKETKEQRDQAVAKLEAMETELKRLRQEASTAKDAVEKLTRQAKKDKDELLAENRVTEELRQDLKQLRDQHTKALTQLDEFRTQGEAKDRQLASASEDVRRSKKEVEGLNAQLGKLARERDEQIRNINSQTGDVDRLRDILKEREKIIEEQRVGIVNQEAQIKDLRKRTEDMERELADVKGKFDNLRERYGRAQTQMEELHHMVVGQQQGGGEQLLQITQENRTLRQEVQGVTDKLTEKAEHFQKLQAEFGELQKQLEKITEERQAEKQAAQQAAQEAQQAVAHAVEQNTTELKARYEGDLRKLADARDAAEEERDNLRNRAAELEAQVKNAASQVKPAAESGGGAALAELKAVATSAYDGISDSFGGLRKNLVDLEEIVNKVERGISDKDAAKKLRQTFEEVQNCFDDARSQIRSLRTVIE